MRIWERNRNLLLDELIALAAGMSGDMMHRFLMPLWTLVSQFRLLWVIVARIWWRGLSMSWPGVHSSVSRVNLSPTPPFLYVDPPSFLCFQDLKWDSTNTFRCHSKLWNIYCSLVYSTTWSSTKYFPLTQNLLFLRAWSYPSDSCPAASCLHIAVNFPDFWMASSSCLSHAEAFHDTLSGT